MNNVNIQKRRIQRPIGVYIMAAYDFLVMGLIPLVTFVFALRGSDVEAPFYTVLLSVLLYFGVMGAAVWAWAGDDVARWLLLAIVTLVALQWIGSGILMLVGEDLASGNKPQVIGFMVRGSTALALNWWYFNRKNVVAYYKKAS